MSNKNEATWHPNSGPVSGHTGLIAEARALGADSPRADLLSVARQLSDALVVLGNSVPHDADCEAVHFIGSVAPPWTPCGCDERRVATAQRERDEARAERDALAVKLSTLRHLADTSRPSDWLVPAIDIIEAIDTTPPISLARHDAEVKAQALEEAADSAPHGDECEHIGGRAWCAWAEALHERAAAIRADAK
jgi:hypothetical protein